MESQLEYDVENEFEWKSYAENFAGSLKEVAHEVSSARHRLSFRIEHTDGDDVSEGVIRLIDHTVGSQSIIWPD